MIITTGTLPVSQPILKASPQLAALEDRVVVRRVLAGETELFEILMRRHNQRVYRVVRGILSDAAEAEDVTQEAYVSAFDKLASFRGDSSFSTWLTKIAVYEALARRRKRPRLVAIDEGRPPQAARASETPERETANRELRRMLQEAVDALPETLRPVFVLREVEGLSGEETAEVLGLSSGNVRVRLHRAKGILRNRLDRQLGREARQLYTFDGQRCDRLVAAVFARIGEERPG